MLINNNLLWNQNNINKKYVRIPIYAKRPQRPSDIEESTLKESTISKDKMHGKPVWVCHFCGKSGHIRPNCYKLQVAKRVNKPKVPVPQAQYPIALIGELVKALNLYSNLGVGNHSNVNTNSNARGASKKFWMQKIQTNWVFLTWSLYFIVLPLWPLFFVLWFLCFLFSCL